MKPSIKNNIILLFLVLIFGIAGCTTTVKRTKNESNQNSQGIVDSSGIGAISFAQKLKLHSTPSNIQTGRYSTIKSKPTLSQCELLQVMITVSIPDEITSIGQTIRYLLKRSGYQLVQPKAQQTELAEFLYKRLPEVHRQIGPMTLEDALTILTAPAFTLHEDPVRRLISYKLNKRFAGEI